jgi:hypothetical protein
LNQVVQFITTFLNNIRKVGKLVLSITYCFILYLFNMAPKWFLSATNFVLWPTGDPHPTLLKNPELILYELCDNPVAIITLVHVSCPSCGVRNTLFHFMNTELPISYIVLWPIIVSHSTEMCSHETHQWPSWGPTCYITDTG